VLGNIYAIISHVFIQTRNPQLEGLSPQVPVVC